jgi:uncharacterized protein (DUF305 family)
MRFRPNLAAILLSAALTAMIALAQHPAGHGDMNKKGQGAKTTDAPYDLHYIDMMVEHHRMGIHMAKMAQDKALHAELKERATKMVEDQQKDSDQLQKWRDEWYAGQPKSDHMNRPGMSGMSKSDHAKMKGMSGMNMQQMDMGKLEAASGNEFDLMFIDMIVPHHQMAIDMSQDALKKAQQAPLKAFARTTVDKQQKEKAQLTKWRAAWGGK